MVEGFKVFLELERRFELEYYVRKTPSEKRVGLTSASGMRGGPEAISAAFVPGRILLVDPSSCLAASPS